MNELEWKIKEITLAILVSVMLVIGGLIFMMYSLLNPIFHQDQMIASILLFIAVGIVMCISQLYLLLLLRKESDDWEEDFV